MITRAEGAYLGAVRAFQNPMLDLLHKRHAPLVVSVLSVCFTPERPTVSVADAHTQIGDALDQLRAAGYDESLPMGTARDLCRQWADAGWLMRQVVDDVEVYRLSAHAVGALEVARVHRVERDVAQALRQLCRLLPAELVERRVGPTLPAVIAVPVGLAVPYEDDGGHCR